MRHAVLLLALAGAAVSSAASAQVSYNRPAPGGYGGGLVEMLVTGGGAPVSAYPARRAAAPAIGGRAPQPYGYAPDPYADPFADPAPVGRGRRYSAIPQDPAYGLIESAPRADFSRREVAYSGGEPAGSIVVDTPSKFLYHVHGGGRATRYGIGVGRPGFTWAGIKTVSMKREWPDWTPPPEMLRRRPDLPRHMEGGPANPLGARALYLGSSLYRIHGTNEPHTIGRNVSSGCIRMMNEDVEHLYDQVRVGTRVKVI